MSTLTNSIAADQAQTLPADASGWQPELGDEACQQPGRAPTEPQCHLAAVRFLPRPLSDFLRPSSPGPGGRWPSPTTSKQQGSSKWDSRETVVPLKRKQGHWQSYRTFLWRYVCPRPLSMCLLGPVLCQHMRMTAIEGYNTCTNSRNILQGYYAELTVHYV